MTDLLDNRYKLLQELGEGGSGSVYLAQDYRLDKQWAVKRVASLSEEEIQALKTINMPVFPRIVDIITDDINYYIVMDYIEGVPLSRIIQERTISESELTAWASDISTALCYLHNLSPALIYMDCKPDNIILCPDGSIRLVDLGSIYIMDEARGRISGTVHYAAPEQLSGEHIDERTDIYGLGMTIYTLLNGSHQEYRDSTGRLDIRSSRPDVSHGMAHIISKCTETSPANRYQHMRDVTAALRAVSNKRDIHRFLHLSQRGILLIIKALLCAFTLVSMYTYRESQDICYYLLGTALIVLLLSLCHSRNISWLCLEDVYRGIGVRILSAFLISGILLISLRPADVAMACGSAPHITITDAQGHSCLFYGQSSSQDGSDMTIKIPVSSLTQGYCPVNIMVD